MRPRSLHQVSSRSVSPLLSSSSTSSSSAILPPHERSSEIIDRAKLDKYSNGYPGDVEAALEDDELASALTVKPRAFRKVRMPVRWYCHECDHLYLTGHKTCVSCEHRRCQDCRRVPYVFFFFSFFFFPFLAFSRMISLSLSLSSSLSLSLPPSPALSLSRALAVDDADRVVVLFQRFDQPDRRKLKPFWNLILRSSSPSTLNWPLFVSRLFGRLTVVTVRSITWLVMAHLHPSLPRLESTS